MPRTRPHRGLVKVLMFVVCQVSERQAFFCRQGGLYRNHNGLQELFYMKYRNRCVPPGTVSDARLSHFCETNDVPRFPLYWRRFCFGYLARFLLGYRPDACPGRRPDPTGRFNSVRICAPTCLANSEGSGRNSATFVTAAFLACCR